MQASHGNPMPLMPECLPSARSCRRMLLVSAHHQHALTCVSDVCRQHPLHHAAAARIMVKQYSTGIGRGSLDNWECRRLLS